MTDARADHLSPHDAALAVVRTLREAGRIAYFAGGCVRDRLLGIEPKDFDVATDAPPPRVRELFKRTQAVGQAFGVILVRLGGQMIEVATFRTDADYADGRHPTSVQFSTPEHDAERRDFTINGLFFDPIEGKVIDYVGGQADLERRVLRAIGDPAQRFAEDFLRMLRAVRFAARFNLTLDASTADAIRANASKLTMISAERIADELRRMLSLPTRSTAYVLLWDLTLIDSIFAPLGSRAAPLQGERSLLMHFASGKSVSFAAALLAAMIDYRWQSSGMKRDLLSNFASADAKKLTDFARRQFKLSNDELDEMAEIGRWVHAIFAGSAPTIAIIRRILARPCSAAVRGLVTAMGSLSIATARTQFVEGLFTRYESADNAPLPLLSGDDLVAAGYSPGPAFKHALDRVYDAQLEDLITDKAEAASLAKTLL